MLLLFLYNLQWNAFSLPELNNFLLFLQNEEQQQISLIKQNCQELKVHMIERMNRLSSVSNSGCGAFSQYEDSMLY